MREKDIEKKFRDGIKKLGGLCYKFVSPGNSGVPDRLVILKSGKVIFVELKTSEGKTSALQKRQIQRIQDHKILVAVLRGMEDVDTFLGLCKLYEGERGWLDESSTS